MIDRSRLKWLRLNVETEFVQFAHVRLSRTPFPMGGYLYEVKRNGGDSKDLYSGNSMEKALAAVQANNHQLPAGAA